MRFSTSSRVKAVPVFMVLLLGSRTGFSRGSVEPSHYSGRGLDDSRGSGDRDAQARLRPIDDSPRPNKFATDIPPKQSSMEVPRDLTPGESVSTKHEKDLKDGKMCVLIGYSNERGVTIEPSGAPSYGPKMEFEDTDPLKKWASKIRGSVKINDNAPNGSTDSAMKGAWTYYRGRLPRELLFGFSSKAEFLQALSKCPDGKDIIIDTHGTGVTNGRGKANGGFCVSKGECLDDTDLESIAFGLKNRKNVSFLACEMAESAVHYGGLKENFVNKLVNRVYELSENKGKVDPLTGEEYKPRFTAYSRTMSQSDTRGTVSLRETSDSFKADVKEAVFYPDHFEFVREAKRQVLAEYWKGTQDLPMTEARPDGGSALPDVFR